jgi:hypothetical protein
MSADDAGTKTGAIGKRAREMRIELIRVLAVVVGLVSLNSPSAWAQPVPQAEPAPPPASGAPLRAAQLDQLVAPIALSPDPLLAQILMAATYPLEIVEADRWLQVPANAALQGDALTAAVDQQPWDPSIKSLVPFPAVLRMMDENLDWTEQLGDAFLAQQADVMDAVQRLRRRAEAAGSLVSTPQQTVVGGEEGVAIEPTNPADVYVPAYNPWCAYGAWPYADYPPFYFGPESAYCVPILTFGAAFYPPFDLWDWGFFVWPLHLIRINHERFRHFHARYEPPGGVWEHNPAHRQGVPYRNPTVAARFGGAEAAARREFRGFPTVPAAAPRVLAPAPRVERAPTVLRGEVSRPAVPRPVAPAFQSFGRGAQIRSEAARGYSSRMAPIHHFAPVPAFHAAPAGGFHGGGFSGVRGGGIGGHR